MVYQVAKACRIPVMGCGGVATARDVIEMMMAGATAVQVGAENLRNPYACKEIIEALPAEMERLGIAACGTSSGWPDSVCGKRLPEAGADGGVPGSGMDDNFE